MQHDLYVVISQLQCYGLHLYEVADVGAPSLCDLELSRYVRKPSAKLAVYLVSGFRSICALASSQEWPNDAIQLALYFVVREVRHTFGCFIVYLGDFTIRVVNATGTPKDYGAVSVLRYSSSSAFHALPERNFFLQNGGPRGKLTSRKSPMPTILSRTHQSFAHWKTIVETLDEVRSVERS